MGFIQGNNKKKKSKMETKKNIYTHFIYKLKNLVQMSCYIYKMLMLRGMEKDFTQFREKRKTYFKKGRRTASTSNL